MSNYNQDLKGIKLRFKITSRKNYLCNLMRKTFLSFVLLSRDYLNNKIRIGQPKMVKRGCNKFH